MQAVESPWRVQRDRVLIKIMAFRYYFMHLPQLSSSLNESHQRGGSRKDSAMRPGEIQGPDYTRTDADKDGGNFQSSHQDP